MNTECSGRNITEKGNEMEKSEHGQTGEALQLIIEETSQAIGKEFFGVLVKSLAKVLGFQYALVGEIVKPGADRINTLAVWAGDEFVDNFEYELKGTPCENVVGQELCLYDRNVQEQFPGDDLLVEMAVESYLGTPLFDSSGQALGILVVMDTKPMEQVSFARSILPVFATRAALELERNSAEKVLRDNDERFKTIMDGLDALVYIADMDTYEVLFVNKYAQNIWGDITGATCWKTLQSNQSGPCEFCTNEKLVDANGKSTGVYKWEFQNTVDNKWYDCHDRAIKWTDGRLVRLEIAGNITERKQAESEVRDQKDFLEHVIESLSHPFYVLDANDYKIKLANSATVEYGGIVLGTSTCYAISHKRDKPCDSQECLCPLEEVKKTKKPVVLEHIHYNREGEARIVEVHGHPVLDSDGNVIQLLEYCLDITDRKLAEEKARKLEAELAVFKERLTLLTDRECEVMKLVGSGKANKVIALELGISHKTVEIHRGRMMEKLKLDSVADLVRYLTKTEISS